MLAGKKEECLAARLKATRLITSLLFQSLSSLYYLRHL